MRSSIFLSVAVTLAFAACGDNVRPPIDYTNPPKGGALRLVKNNHETTADEIVLDLVVGDAALTGYSVGFDLPIPGQQVRLSIFVAGHALDGGTAPVAARGLLPVSGPLANMLVTAQSQKASGEGAIATDTMLPPGSVLYTIHLVKAGGAPVGVVFDGTAADFVLPSGGMRNRAGATVVESKDVSIGKLEIVH